MRRVQLALLAGSAFVLLSAIPAVAQLDPSGEWAPRFHEDQPERIPGPEIGDYLGLPINAADRLKADTWDASILELPEHQCMPHPSDYAWRGPANLRIWKEIDRETQDVIAYHTHISWQAQYAGRHGQRNFLEPANYFRLAAGIAEFLTSGRKAGDGWFSPADSNGRALRAGPSLTSGSAKR